MVNDPAYFERMVQVECAIGTQILQWMALRQLLILNIRQEPLGNYHYEFIAADGTLKHVTFRNDPLGSPNSIELRGIVMPITEIPARLDEFVD